MARIIGALALALTLVAGCAFEDFDSKDTGSTGGAAGSSGASGGWKAAGGGAGTGSIGSTGGGSGKTPAGLDCANPGDCASGLCFDGVCCQSECSGTCESCNLPGSAGTCQPHPAGSDPDSECLDSQQTSTGSCAGRCDGNRACKMPSAETHCGPNACSGDKQVAEVCNGQGACVTTEKGCAPFTCDNGACVTTCTSDAHCADPKTWCKQGSCANKFGPGVPCTADSQCDTDHCVDGVCCDSSSCPAPFSCSTGTCACGNTPCAPGMACVPWYEDTDGDGFGDKTKSILSCAYGSGSVIIGGKKYAINGDDCFDGNKNVFPGQTAFFGTHRGDGSFDYDCNGSDEKKYATVSSPVCRDCHGYGSSSAACSLTCGTLGLASMGVTCNLPGNCGGPKDTTVFAVDVACGGAADLKSCNDCHPSYIIPESVGLTQQTCR